MFRSRLIWLLSLALAAGSCVDSGNHGWDLGRWAPPLVAQEQVEAYRGVHEGRIGLRCVRGGQPKVFIETWRPLTPEGPPTPASLTYRLDGSEHSAPGQLRPTEFEFSGSATSALLEQLGPRSRMEALIPVHSGGVYPVTFDVSDFAAALEWVRHECGRL